MLSLNDVVKCISLYMSNLDNSLYSVHGTIIRDLCLARDNHYQSPHLLSYTEIVMFSDRRAKLGQIQGVAEGHPRFAKGGGGGCNSFLFFTR